MTRFDGRAIDQVLQDAAASGGIPGAVALVLGPEGVLHTSTAGALPDGARTVFRLASMTKALTSVAALQLVEQGRLALDAPVAAIIPSFGDLQVLEGFDGDRPRLRPPASAATVRQLLTHTAGHGYMFLNADLERYHRVTGVPDPFSGALASLAAPLVADPGTRWEYGINTDWLGRVVETASGRTLDAQLAATVFEPLRMTDATFAPSAPQRARLMPIHARQDDGSLAVSELELPAAPEFWPGGHGAHATAGDYGRFLRALLRGGELDGARILRPETVELMFTNQIGGIPLPTEMKSVRKDLANDVPAPPFRATWGLGLQVMLEDIPGMRRAGSGFWSGIFNTYYWIDRATGIAVLFCTQVLPFFDVGVVPVIVGVETGVYAQVPAAAVA